jgi:tetratricopeptide (TPR) repeat protein
LSIKEKYNYTQTESAATGLGDLITMLLFKGRKIKKLVDEGHRLQVSGCHEEAIKCYASALTLDNINESAWYQKGAIHAKIGQYKEAIECYNNALLLQKSDVAWSGKGDCYANLKQFKEAIECYKNAITMNERRVDANNQEMWRLENNRQYNESSVWALRSHTEQGINNKIWEKKGDCYSNLEQYEEALECYQNASRTSSDARQKKYEVEQIMREQMVEKNLKAKKISHKKAAT